MKKTKGFTLLTSIVVTSMLLLVSFIVADIALKQLVLSYANQESQFSFYNADTGLECAEYWDLSPNVGTSAFSSTTSGSLTCNNENVFSNSQTVPAHGSYPTQMSTIGGVSDGYPSSFMIDNLAHGCVIVNVTKNVNGTTLIESFGYNTCDTTSDRRFERGIKVQY